MPGLLTGDLIWVHKAGGRASDAASYSSRVSLADDRISPDAIRCGVAAGVGHR
jgi:hypothetical protein